METIETLDLSNICNGALPEIFERELAKILENINDPNTDVDKTRMLTVELVFTPFPDRMGAQVELRTKTKLPGVPAQSSTVFIGKHGGKLVAVPKDVNQRALFGAEPPKGDNVVDMAKKSEGAN